MLHHSKSGYTSLFVQKMEKEDIPGIVIDTFAHYYHKLTTGEKGLIPDKDIDPIGDTEIPGLEDVEQYAGKGRNVLKNTIMIALNGGLGTSMGLEGPKSLIEARDGKSFLDIILAQAEMNSVRLGLMNSFSTHKETLGAISKAGPEKPPLTFLQNRFPKVLQKDLSPVVWPPNPKLEWNPPGHGDIFLALYISGTLNQLLEMGIRYAFIANSDNLGAVLDPAILGYFAANDYPFMMEAARKTPSDVKGGHLARSKTGGLLLRESAQCPDDEIDAFKDIERYRFFNTNNIWVNLSCLMDHIKKEGFFKLPMIVNPKHVDPRDDSTPAVYQIETAMGSAISLFDRAAAINTPRTRFFPVKKCSDLLVVRSDRFFMKDGCRITLNPENETERVKVDLDSKFYKKIDQFSERFQYGPPSLKKCESLTVKGDVYFGENVTVAGNVVIENTTDGPVTIPGGTVVDGDMKF